MAMLRDVVAEGTGTLAVVPGYQVAGKTGTAAKPDPRGGYSTSRYVASFVGIVPASEPAARDPRHRRRAARRDLGRRRRGAGVRGDREVRPAVPRGPAGRAAAAPDDDRRPPTARLWRAGSRAPRGPPRAPAATPLACAGANRARRLAGTPADRLGRSARWSSSLADRALAPRTSFARSGRDHRPRLRRARRRRRPARSSSASAARAPTGTTSPPRRSSAARWRSSSSGRSTSPCRSSSSPTRARRWRRGRRVLRAADAELEVAGVTGTNGKTTTAFLLYSILDAAGRRPGCSARSRARVGGERAPAVRTTPEAIDLQRTFREMLDAGDRSCAMEATSHGSALRRLDYVRFSALVFTNLTQDHLDFHGTMERYFEAKRRLFARGRPPAPPSTSATSRGAAARRRARRGAGPSASPTTPRPSRVASTLGSRRALPRARRDRPQAARPLQRRERARRGRRGALLGDRRRRDRRAGIEARRAACPGASRRSTRASRSPCSSTTRTRPTRSPRR